MLTKLRVRAQSESGFTLVELLVVMLIIGLLAAIAIPAFFNQRDKAKDSSAKEAVRTAQTAMETYNTDNDGEYTGATVALLEAIEPTLADADLAVLDSGGAAASVPGADDYRVTVTSETGNTFSIDRASTSALTYPCTTGGNAGCPETGATDLWN